MNRIFKITFFTSVVGLIGLGICGLGVQKAGHAGRRNLVLFVADGLRHAIVTPQNAPNLYGLSQNGVSFPNSHSVYPTLTMANASVISTGHLQSDTGVFGNDLFVSFPVVSAGGSSIPFLENDAVLTELNSHYDEDLINGQTLLSTAQDAGYNVAAIGKVGPSLLNQIPNRNRPNLIVVDDQTGSASGVALPDTLKAALQTASLGAAAPSRGDNGNPGAWNKAGTLNNNHVQQDYFLQVTTQVVIPNFKTADRPFLLLFWSRDPDGTQHNQGDSLNALVPGINGPTSLAAIQNADHDLGEIIATIKRLGLEAETDLIVTSDHGFSTISLQSASSFAATQSYGDVRPQELPPGFLAIDLANALDLKMYDPDNHLGEVAFTQGKHSTNGHGILGTTSDKPSVIVAANGGSDLIYLQNDFNNPASARRVVNALLEEDYVGGIFVQRQYGEIPGTIPLDTLGLEGQPHTPQPSIFFSFRSYASRADCSSPTLCVALVSDTTLQQGQGMHGSFGRQDTFNFTAMSGPDFKKQFADPAPISNADLAPTISQILGLPIAHTGDHRGRTINEALINGQTPAFNSGIIKSKPAADFQTIIKFQEVNGRRYFDCGGDPKRTIGCEMP